MSLGLPNHSGNRQKVEFKAHQIAEDIFCNRLDSSLARYNAERILAIEDNISPEVAIAIDLVQLWAKYCQIKKGSVAPGTWKDGYMVMSSHIERCPYKALDQAQKLFDWSTESYT